MLGWPEILLVLAVMLLIFGPSKLPEMAKSLGQAFREFQNATVNIEKEAKAITDSLPDLNSPMAMAPQSSILRKPLNNTPAPQNVNTVAASAPPQPAAPQPTAPQAATSEKSNIVDVAKMLGINAEGRTEEDLKIAIHDKIDGLDEKEV